MRELFGYRVASLEMTRERLVETDLFTDPGELCEYYKANFGPTIAVYANVAAEPERTAALDRNFAEFAERWNRGARSCHPPGFPAPFDRCPCILLGESAPQCEIRGE